jgi:hypothetical protein
VTASFQADKIKGWQIIEEDSENDDPAVGFFG